MDFKTDRDVAKRHRIAGLDFRLLAGNDSLTDFQAFRSKNIAFLTIGIRQKSDKSGTVRIVFDLLNDCGHTIFVALEVDHSVTALVTVSTEAAGDSAGIVASAGSFFTFGKALFRSGTGQFGIIKNRDVSAALGNRIKRFCRHVYTPYARSIEPSAREITAFFQSGRLPGMGDLPERFILPLQLMILTDFTLTP